MCLVKFVPVIWILLDTFFGHENQDFPPSLSTYGDIRTGTKSDILQCLKSQLDIVRRVDIVWDVYIPDSLKFTVRKNIEQEHADECSQITRCQTTGKRF